MTTASEWISGGQRVPIELAGAPRHVFERIGGAGSWCTLLHGFPTSSFDWHRVWDGLVSRRRVLALDFLGFGDSDKPADHDYAIHEQATLVERLWERHDVRDTVVVAHDYAVSVAQELLARQEEGGARTRIARIVFLNGGLYPDLHRPRPAQTLLLDPVSGPAVSRAITEATFVRSLLETFPAATPPSPSELHEQWEVVRRRDGHLLMHRLIGYIRDRERHAERWIGALERTSVPRHFVWGMLDPVSGAHMAARIAERLPRCERIELANVAHWPQLEAPQAVSSVLHRVLDLAADAPGA